MRSWPLTGQFRLRQAHPICMEWGQPLLWLTLSGWGQLSLFLGHVGDSRAYMLHNGRLTQITSDHSLVGELVRNGSLSKDEAFNHPHRHVVTQALGIGEIEVETFTTKLDSADRILLCTDGLTDVVADQQIQEVLVETDPESAAHKLIDIANTQGGPDNITVILIEIP